MLTIDDIAAWDATTASRGRAYARSGRVTILRTRRGVTDADVQGSDLYRVRVQPELDDYACDCPVGATGALCKHVAAVLVVLEQETTFPDDDAATGADEVTRWLDALDPAATRALLHLARDEFPQVADLLAREYVSSSADVGRLTAEINAVLTPRRTFYEYGAANRYADEADGIVGTIEELAERSRTPELLKAVERALTLVVRATLRSDDSAGGHGMLIERLLTVHETVANGGGVAATAKDRRRLATWLFRFRFDGTQDFFDPDVDRYAAALGAEGVAEYRALVGTEAAHGRHEYAVQHARERLAVLDRDADEIVRAFGRDLPGQYAALRVSQGLDEAGFADEALAHARRGLALDPGPHHGRLVDRVVAGAVAAGDPGEAVNLRAAHLRRMPSAITFEALRAQARDAGTWDGLREASEQVLAEHDPAGLLSVLLGDGRDDEAWELAVADADAARYRWPELCERRARTHPEQTLPYYRTMVTDTLRTTGAHSYAIASRLLVAMRSAAGAAGRSDEFVAFMTEVVEANRRRPTCIDRFVSDGLIARDRSVRRG
ncbi:SWIM zinc finger family protein [Cellulomonas composti]|uniref:SWIM-type domain-containing protein n=1 Tax=Cellulomonas composti TaxID=266130 RepID=A0A511J7E0_9CELL|nr:SWIM zinc finger family protein [Cellulomonas composti]GEL93894.1 hypothetical protein CCO02nite_05520 [Cellulomonas composti]